MANIDFDLDVQVNSAAVKPEREVLQSLSCWSMCSCIWCVI